MITFMTAEKKFGILYDDAFLRHRAQGYHPECPERLAAAREFLEDAGLWAKAEVRGARPATPAELGACHDPRYVREALSALASPPGHFDADTFFSEGSLAASLGAAGGTIDLGRDVFDGKLAGGFALVRPPGHHATRGRAMGFCIFNNIAACAAALLESKRAERVWIVDFDVHHGNGTQDIFYPRGDLLFSSIHQWPFYPGSGTGDELGAGAGKGFTVNVPWPAGAGDDEYLSALRDFLVPLAEEFKPQAILASAGFDAHHEDLLGGMKLTREGYAGIAQLLLDAARRLCDGRLLFVLEGGYNVEASAEALGAIVAVMTGKKAATDAGPPGRRYKDSVDRTRSLLAPHWKGVL